MIIYFYSIAQEKTLFISNNIVVEVDYIKIKQNRFYCREIRPYERMRIYYIHCFSYLGETVIFINLKYYTFFLFFKIRSFFVDLQITSKSCKAL